MEQTSPANVGSNEWLGPLPEAEWLAGENKQAWKADTVQSWPVLNASRYTVPLFTARQLQSAVVAALDAREFVHAESSRVYARLASAVRSGADDATLAKLLRAEVNARA